MDPQYSQPVTELIRQRYSCRTYDSRPIDVRTRQRLADLVGAMRAGPFGTTLRLQLLTATEDATKALRGLGTYGFVRGNSGFVVGATVSSPMDMEDFGYRMEQVVLLCTDLGLGTCWLGGTFNRSAFADRIGVQAHETMPAAIAVGYIADRRSLMDRLIRRGAAGHSRLPWEHLFFLHDWGSPLSREEAGPYAIPLEMARLAPSASNKQPWRILNDSGLWHFFLQRSPGYQERYSNVLGLADMQRVDLGITLCHFEETAHEVGLQGEWTHMEAHPLGSTSASQYVLTWLAG